MMIAEEIHQLCKDSDVMVDLLFLIKYTIKGIIIGFTIGIADVMYPGINVITEQGSLISSNNLIFLDLEDGYNWNLH